MEKFKYVPNEGVGFGDAEAILLKSGNRYGVGILESAGDGAAAEAFGDQQLRATAMGVVLGFVAAGEFSYDAMNGAIFVLADMDGDETLTDDEEEYLSALYQAVADALFSIGVDPADISSLLDDEDDSVAEKVGAFLAGKIEGTEKDDETIITDYATTGDMVMEAMKKVVRNGQVVLKRKRVGRPHKIGSAQKAALRKARTKAFTGAAKAARRKSVRLRGRLGL